MKEVCVLLKEFHSSKETKEAFLRESKFSFHRNMTHKKIHTGKLVEPYLLGNLL